MIKKITFFEKSLGYKWQQEELVSATCFRMRQLVFRMQFAIHDWIVNCILECCLQFKIFYSVCIPKGLTQSGGAQGTNYHPCKNIFSSLGDPPPPLPNLLWSEKSSGSETSKAPTQGPEMFRMGLRGQSTPPVKI